MDNKVQSFVDENKHIQFVSSIDDIKTKVFEGLGEASMCWSETPKGIFDSTHAKKVGDEIMAAIENNVGLATHILFEALKRDNQLYYAYQANIAMAFKDEYDRQAKSRHYIDLNKIDIHEVANTAAKYFLDQLIEQTLTNKGMERQWTDNFNKDLLHRYGQIDITR